VVLSKARAIVVLFVLVASAFTVTTLVSSPQPAASLILNPGQAWRPNHPTPSQNLYAPAAEALRKGNLQDARQHLDTVAAQHPEQAAQARVVAGLYAHEAGDLAQAQDLLSKNGDSKGELEDWRLYLLAESANRRGEYELARSTYARLIAEHRSSPLRPLASLEAAKLAADHQQPQLALSLVEEARKGDVKGKVAEELDQLAWKVARQIEDERGQRAAGLLLDAGQRQPADVDHGVRRLDALAHQVDEVRAAAEALRTGVDLPHGGGDVGRGDVGEVLHRLASSSAPCATSSMASTIPL